MFFTVTEAPRETTASGTARSLLERKHNGLLKWKESGDESKGL
jgi:hypothetical protein